MPLGVVQMVVEPPQQDLLRRQPQELLQSLAVFEETIELRMQLNINFAQQPSSDDLPDQTKDQVLRACHDIS